MQILEYGKKPQKKWIKKCCTCKSKLVYENKDIDIDTNGSYYIKCPICEEYLRVGFFEKRYNPNKHGVCTEGDKRRIGFGD